VGAVQALDPPLRDPDRPVEFFYEEIKDTTVIFRIRFWTSTDQLTFLKARSEAIKAINQTFLSQKISLPSAVVTLDFGIGEGKSLSEQLGGVELSLSAPREERAGNETASRKE
jgi:small-conductance mechanosensitive channel